MYDTIIAAMPYKFLLLFVIAGCASAPPNRDGVTTTIENVKVKNQHVDVDFTHESLIKSSGFLATPQRVWAAMLEASQAIGLKAIAVDSARREASFENVGIRSVLGKPISHYVDCGRGAGNVSRADTYSVTMRVDEKVGATDGTRTDLATKITFTARNRGMSSDQIQCSTLGTLEELIANLVATRLQ